MLSQVWLVLRKDLCRIRWMLLVFAALVGAGAAMNLWATTSQRMTAMWWMTLLPLIPWLLGWVATATVVHEDVLVGTRAQWMTRPLRPWAVLAAKTLLLGICFGLLPAIVDTALLGYLGLELSGWPSAAAVGFLAYGVWLLGAFAIASVTNGTAAYLVTGVTALVGLGIATVAAAEMGADIGPDLETGETVGDKFALLLLPVLAYVVVRQYRRSGTLASRSLLALGVLATPFAMLIRLPDPAPAPVEFAGPPLGASLTALAPEEHQSERVVNVRFSTARAESDRAYELRTLVGELTVDDGRRLSFEDLYFDVGGLQGQIIHLDTALRAALPEYAWSGPSKETNGRSTNLFLWSDKGSADVSPGTHALTARGQVQSHRFERVGKLALQGRARLRSHGIAVQVTEVEMKADELKVDVRFSTAVSAGARDRSLVTEVDYVLVNPARRRAARSPQSFGAYGQAEFLGPRIEVSAGSARVAARGLRYEKTPDGAFDSLEQLELQVWKLVPAEKYTAEIEEPEFVVRARGDDNDGSSGTAP